VFNLQIRLEARGWKVNLLDHQMHSHFVLSDAATREAVIWWVFDARFVRVLMDWSSDQVHMRVTGTLNTGQIVSQF
jgi:hypothetical protein